MAIATSSILAYLLRFNFNLQEIEAFNPVRGILLLTASGIVGSFLTKSYAGIVRYTGIQDGIRIFYSNSVSLGLVALCNLVAFYSQERNVVPYSILLISFFISYLFLFVYRLFVKSVFTHYRSEASLQNNVVIFGAGSLGQMTTGIIEADTRRRNKVVAYLEDDPKKTAKDINGVKILPVDELTRLVKKFDVKELIIAVRTIPTARKNELVEMCFNLNVMVRIVPPVDKWVKGEFKSQQIKEVRIEDLLGRETIQLAYNHLNEELAGRVICVTGAAGSIGSELVRQLLTYSPKELVLIDQAESPLHDLERDIKGIRSDVPCRTFVADITNEVRMSIIFSEVRPEIVFHAAAYKHVPLMESNPSEAVSTNILGTKILADLSVTLGVKKFVMVSTDKAVNPTNVMGCSKRIAEIYVQALNNHGRILGGRTQFVTTRFGNVLGSNGSVIPTFRLQIQAGGPVTVTHPEITRYFMTIPEACRLVLEAGTMGQGGEIFIFDMGKPVRILDLAKKMIRLSGFEPDKDIDIVFTGLREGEKLYEELLSNQENTVPTHNQKIMIAKVQEYDYTYILSMIDLFNDLLVDKNELKMVTLMKEIVPEFKSNYSRYQILDRD